MASATRNRARNTATNPPPANHGHSHMSMAGAVRDSDDNHRPREPDGASHSNEGPESVHNDHRSSLPEHPHLASSEINALGMHVKDAISIINRLEGLGLQKLNIPLPKIIVLGEQSTGKSSVIEAISNIQTPRSTGTCTRCPLFIKVESSTVPCGWNAHVTLRRGFIWDGKTGRGPERRFPGWYQALEPQIVDFMSTTDPDKLESIIARAQLATVSPLVDPTEFTKGSTLDLEKAHRCRFSPNVVCISISSPGSPSLSFYDLPGIIGQAEVSQDVKFVRDLVVEYVKDPEALILVTCSMETDIANSMAGGIARQLKATDRCIGVLTKPDRLLEASCRDILHDVFETKRLPFGHGYFVVRNPGQDQLDGDVTHDDARMQERRFFETKEPFSTDFLEHGSRFGTLNLQAFLSGKLAEQITNKLPIIQEEINARLSEIEDDLKHYPNPPTHNASRVIFDLVLEYSQSVRQEIDGAFPCKNWRADWKALQQALFGSLMSLKPTMATTGSRDSGIYKLSLNSSRSSKDAIVVSDDEHEDDTDGDVRMSKAPETPTKKRKIESTPGPSPLKMKGSSDTSVKPRVPIADFGEVRTKYQLDEVSKHLLETSHTRVPGRLEHRVTDAMMLQTLQNWQLPLNSFFDKLEELLSAQLHDLFDKCFRKWSGTALYKTAWKIVTEMLSLNLHQQRTIMASESLDDEKNGVYIFHSEIFSHDKEAILEHYREARFRARFNVYKNERTGQTKKIATQAEQVKMLKDENLVALLKHEPYNVELDVAAEVTTYYMMAARRLHDSICMRVESKFFKQLRIQLRDELENGLGIHDELEGHGNAVRLLAENPQREEQRQALLMKQYALLQGQQILRDLQQKNYNNNASSQASSTNIVDEVGGSFFGMPTPVPEEMDEM